MKLSERVKESITMLCILERSMMIDPSRSDTVILIKPENVKFVLDDAVELMTAFKDLLEFPINEQGG